MEIDEEAFEKVFRDYNELMKVNIRESLATYLAALPKPEHGRDRIAVSRFESGDSACQFLESDESPNWDDIESFIDWDAGQVARYIVRANCPPPVKAEPAEVEGSVEGVS
jgi:hypothetical protein